MPKVSAPLVRLVVSIFTRSTVVMAPSVPIVVVLPLLEATDSIMVIFDLGGESSELLAKARGGSENCDEEHRGAPKDCGEHHGPIA